MRKLNARILALVLILVFTQKLGLGIWMHNWLHETGVPKGAALHEVGVKGAALHEVGVKGHALPDVDKITVNCHCIDDFLVPLVKTPVVVAPVPVRELPVLACVYCSSFHTVTSSFASLRGPPVVTVSC